MHTAALPAGAENLACGGLHALMGVAAYQLFWLMTESSSTFGAANSVFVPWRL
jgi:hypothetical protein